MQITPHQQDLITRVTAKFEQTFKIINKVSDRKKITIYGSARLREDTALFAEIAEFSKGLREDGWMVISGGGPGVMKAALDGQVNNLEDETIAFQIDINKEKQVSKADIGVKFSDFFVRKYFLRIADVFVIAPGGFGTLDEVFEVLTLVQTHKLKNRKIIFYDREYWSPLLDWFGATLLKQGMISEADLMLYQVADTPAEVLSLVAKPS